MYICIKNPVRYSAKTEFKKIILQDDLSFETIWIASDLIGNVSYSS